MPSQLPILICLILCLLTAPTWSQQSCVLVVDPLAPEAALVDGVFLNLSSALSAIEALPPSSCPLDPATQFPLVSVQLNPLQVYTGPANTDLSHTLLNYTLHISAWNATSDSSLSSDPSSFSSDASIAILDAQSSSPILSVSGRGALLLSFVELRNGASLATSGACLSVSGDVSSLSLHAARFSACASSMAGGALFVASPSVLRLSAVSFLNNSAALQGGAVAVLRAQGPSALQGCVFAGNSAQQAGGALYAEVGRSSHLALQACSFSGNAALQGAGGAVSVTSDSSPFAPSVTVANSSFEGNLGGQGGGAFHAIGYVQLRFSFVTFIENQAFNPECFVTSLSTTTSKPSSSSSSSSYSSSLSASSTTTPSGGAILLEHGGVQAAFFSSLFLNNSAPLGNDIALVQNSNTPINSPRGINLYQTQLLHSTSSSSLSNRHLDTNHNNNMNNNNNDNNDNNDNNTAPSCTPSQDALHQDGSDRSAVFETFACPQGLCGLCPYGSCAAGVGAGGELSSCACFYGDAGGSDEGGKGYVWYFSTGHLVGLGLGTFFVALLIVFTPVVAVTFFKKQPPSQASVVLPSVRLFAPDPNPSIQRNTLHGDDARPLLASPPLSVSQGKQDYLLAPPISRTASNLGEYFNLSSDEEDELVLE